MLRRTMFGIALAAMLCLASGPVRSQSKAVPGDAPLPDSRGWSLKQATDNLRASDKLLRLAALRRLAMEPGPAIQKWLASAAQYDPEPRIRYEAVVILARRKESPSLPLLMWMAENDKDERVRAAAAQGAGVPLSGRKPPVPSQPTPAPGAAPAPVPAPAPGATASGPVPTHVPRYDTRGNELPPGYEDMEKDAEFAAASEEKPAVHSGFLPIAGFDGAIGIPRDTLIRTSFGAVIGYVAGSFDNTYYPQGLGSRVVGTSSFDAKDFSLLLTGRFAPVDFLELGLEIEAMTYESLDHSQSWEADGVPDYEPSDALKTDRGYSGVALGLTSADVKALFVDGNAFRFGMALRITAPSHFGNDKYGSGIGASNHFLEPGLIQDKTT
ncbi:MAG: HEAT repeat domain-containing protein, partial [Deltaproteobacteria bacterium]|nr:HEAT repeat domain-containing protein [Deltaproteobacteria bacterium]